MSLEATRREVAGAPPSQGIAFQAWRPGAGAPGWTLARNEHRERGPLARIPGEPRLAARMRASGPRSQGLLAERQCGGVLDLPQRERRRQVANFGQVHKRCLQQVLVGRYVRHDDS